MKTTFDRHSSIPTGSELRVLLNSAHISYGEVYSTLKRKGIFVGNSDKSITVPILSATLLTFDEFSKLIETSIDRELRPKIKISDLELNSDKYDWITPLKNDLFTTEFNPFSNIESIELVDAPSLVVDSKSKVMIPYMIKRKDYSQDWLTRELDFSGEIVIEQEGSKLTLDFSSTHSSRETELINKRLTERIFKLLKNKGITKSETGRKITFGCFSNVERIRFFKRLTGGFARTLGSGSVNDMEINRDIGGPPLPDDPQVAWMNETVKRLRIDGEKLNNIFLISDEKYYSFYHIQRMDVTFPYSAGTNNGACRVSFSFSSPIRSRVDKDDPEFTSEFVSFAPDKQLNNDAKKELITILNRAVRGLVECEFSKIHKERGGSTT